MTLTEPMKKALRARLAEHGAEAIVGAWTWVLTSTHKRATYLRDGGYDHPQTFLRPSNCATYVDFWRSEQAPAAPSAPTGIVNGKASAVWSMVEAIGARGNIRFPATASTDEERRAVLALHRPSVGGWTGYYNDPSGTRARLLAALARGDA